jgi:hypothetical protein
MSRMKLNKAIIQFGDANQKRRYMAQIGALTVAHEVTMKPWTPRRSNRANAFYFGAVVAALVQFFEEQGQMVSAEYAHDLLVRRNLGEREVMAPDGAVEKLRLETHTLSRDEFSAYVERCIAWLSEYGVEVPDRMQAA